MFAGGHATQYEVWLCFQLTGVLKIFDKAPFPALKSPMNSVSSSSHPPSHDICAALFGYVPGEQRAAQNEAWLYHRATSSRIFDQATSPIPRSPMKSIQSSSRPPGAHICTALFGYMFAGQHANQNEACLRTWLTRSVFLIMRRL